MRVSTNGDKITISDYSKNNDSEILIDLLGAFGVKAEKESDGWCG